MSKQAADRPASAAEVLRAIDEIERVPATTATSPLPSPVARPEIGRPPASTLPAPSTPFIGRERELAEVAAQLANPACRLLTLIGPGGIGKTRLALQAAAAQAPSYAHGAYFVSLAPVSSTDYLLSAVAEALRFTLYGGEEAKVQLINYLRDKQMLLVMDNFEHLLDGASLIADFLAAVPAVKFLVTSQERLNLQGEWLFVVEGMPFPLDTDVRAEAFDPTTFSALQLFVQSARRVDADFQLSAADLPAVTRICQMVAGMPLGIELAAAWVRALTCAEIASEIERNLSFLTTTLRDVPERHRSLQAVFNHSWQRLSDDERRAFRQLSVFLGGFRREAAMEVADTTLAQLSALVDKSLLRRAATGRYGMHGLLRKFAQEKLIEAGEAEAARRRHLVYFLKLADDAETGLRREDQLDWLARLDTEHDNMRAAMKWSLHYKESEAGLRLAGDLARYWYLRGHWHEGREWLQEMLSHTRDEAALSEAVARARARALYGAAWLDNEGEEEAPLYQESLELCRRVGDDWGAAFALRGLGARAVFQGEHTKAAALLDESLSLFQEEEDTWGVALVLFNQGWLAHEQADFGQVEVQWAESLRLFQESGDRWGAAVSLGSLSYLARLRDDYKRAVTLSEDSLTLFRELGDKAGMAASLSRLGYIAIRRGDFQQAAELLEKSQALQHELGSQWGVVSSFNLLGVVACYQGDYQRAAAALSEALEHGLAAGARTDMPHVVANQALLAYLQGDLDRADLLWQESLPIFQQPDWAAERATQAFVLNGLGLVARMRGDLARAEKTLLEAQALAQAEGDRRFIALVLDSQGLVAQSQRDLPRAKALFRESLALRKEMGDKHGIAVSLERVASVVAGPRPVHAARLFGAAQTLREAIGAPTPPVERAEYDQHIAATRSHLSESEFEAAWAEGRSVPLKQVVANVFESSDD
jgi:predicted ATPase